MTTPSPLRRILWLTPLVAALVLGACSDTADAPTHSPASTTPGSSSPGYTTAGPTPATDASPSASPAAAVPEPDCPVEEIDLGITGGRTAGYLYRPAGAGDEPRPLVIVMHDGSAEDAVAGAAEAERAGRIYAGRLCPLGYNVFSVTYRWSAYGREEMADVVGAFGYLSQSPYVDRDRIAAIGPGHGGYMAAFAVSSPLYERPWAAAVNLYGFVDVAEQVRAHPADTQSVLTKNVLGDPETGTDAYAEVSPSELLDSLDAPVLVVVGSEDERAGQLRSYRDEAAAGQVEYLEVQGAGYGIDYGQEPYTTQLWERVIDFLERTLEE